MICRECKNDADIKDFHPKRRSCKKCVYKKHKIWKKNNPGKIREQRRRHRYKYRDNSEYQKSNLEYYRNYYLKHTRRWKKYRPSIDEWHRKNPEKIKAHNKLRFAIQAGIIIRPKNCSKCNRETKIIGHHIDYTKVYDVVWLCASCHRKEHSALNIVS